MRSQCPAGETAEGSIPTGTSEGLKGNGQWEPFGEQDLSEEKPFKAEQLLSSITENERKPLLVNHCQAGQKLVLGESPPEQGWC